MPGRDLEHTQAGLGLRIAELLALRVEDVDFLRRTVRGRLGLGSTHRRVPPAEDGSLFTTAAGLLYRQEHYGARVFPPVVRKGWPTGWYDEP